MKVKQINLRLNTDNEDEKNIIEFLNTFPSKNKAIKSALNLYMVLSNETNTVNPLEIAFKLSFLSTSTNITNSNVMDDRIENKQQSERDLTPIVDMDNLNALLDAISV